MKDIGRIKENIIESASWLFEKYGYEKTSVEEIARRSHKAKASVYYHFRGKLEILKAVLEKEFYSVRRKLEAIHISYSGNIKQQMAIYFTERMKILREAKVYTRYMNSSYIEGKNAVSEIVDKARCDFDSWEYNYFTHICNEGHRLGILSEAVNPDAFGKLILVLMKGLEVQFFHTSDYNSLKPTYEAIVELIIYDSTMLDRIEAGKN